MSDNPFSAPQKQKSSYSYISSFIPGTSTSRKTNGDHPATDVPPLYYEQNLNVNMPQAPKIDNTIDLSLSFDESQSDSMMSGATSNTFRDTQVDVEHSM